MKQICHNNLGSQASPVDKVNPVPALAHQEDQWKRMQFLRSSCWTDDWHTIQYRKEKRLQECAAVEIKLKKEVVKQKLEWK